jgi:hypothetical protein
VTGRHYAGREWQANSVGSRSIAAIEVQFHSLQFHFHFPPRPYTPGLEDLTDISFDQDRDGLATKHE